MKDKLPTEKEKLYLKAKQRYSKAYARMYAKYLGPMVALQKEIEESGDCNHTDYEEYSWEHDNGYGRQSQHIGWYCRTCKAKNAYKTDSKAGWTARKDYLNYD